MAFGFRNLCSSARANDLLSYSTIKIAVIRDWRLGALHYLLELGVLIYIIIFVVILQRGFMASETPLGAVRLNWMEGENPLPMSELSYCGPRGRNFPQVLPCQYMDVHYATPAGLTLGSVFLTTRLQLRDEIYDPFSLDGKNTYVITNSSMYFNADVEDFTLYMDWTALAPTLGINMDAFTTFSGQLQQREQKSTSSGSEWKTISKLGDPPNVFTVRELLKATGINGLDELGNGCANATCESFRYAGVNIALLVSLDNFGTYFSAPKTLEYTYRPVLLSDMDFKFEETIWTAFPTGRTIMNRHGIMVTVVFTGRLGKFQFQALLIQLTTSFALLKVAAVIVDILATKAMPRKERYSSAIYDKTELPDDDEEQLENAANGKSSYGSLK